MTAIQFNLFMQMLESMRLAMLAQASGQTATPSGVVWIKSSNQTSKDALDLALQLAETGDEEHVSG